jgi:hypothetical protein
MNKNAQLQTADQTLKGAALALGSYIAHKNNVDPQIIALSVPVAAGVMAWIQHTCWQQKHSLPIC